MPSIRSLLALLVLPALVSSLAGQTLSTTSGRVIDSVLTGSWSGDVFNAAGSRQRVIVNIVSYVNGPCDATWDAPTYGWIGNRFSSVSCVDGRLLMQADSADVVFQGVVSRSPLQITGTWAERRMNSPVVLKKLVEARRIQEPGPTPPYIAIPMTIPNRPAGIVVGAELTLPDTLGRYPLVIIAGDRDIADRTGRGASGHAPYLVMAAEFAKRNIATLRIDDRGTGQTSGMADAGTIDDEASDMSAALERLRYHPNIDTTRIVLLGHGEGGLAAIVVGARYPGLVQRVAMMAAPALDGRRTLLAQIAARERKRETDEELIGVAVGLVDAWCGVVASEGTDDKIVPRFLAITDSLLEERPDLLVRYPLARQLQTSGREAYVRSTLLPWIRSYIWYSPADYLARLRQPLLALYAEEDIEVPGRTHADALRLQATNGRKTLVEVVADVNHWFQPCSDCTEEERSSLPLSISPDVLSRLAIWILRGA